MLTVHDVDHAVQFYMEDLVAYRRAPPRTLDPCAALRVRDLDATVGFFREGPSASEGRPWCSRGSENRGLQRRFRRTAPGLASLRPISPGATPVTTPCLRRRTKQGTTFSVQLGLSHLGNRLEAGKDYPCRVAKSGGKAGRLPPFFAPFLR